MLTRGEPDVTAHARRDLDAPAHRIENRVADVLGTTHASATYLAGIFTWTAEADDRYQGMAITAASLDLADHGGRVLAARPVVDRDVGAAVGEAERDGTPDAAAAASDEGDPVIEGIRRRARGHRS